LKNLELFDWKLIALIAYVQLFTDPLVFYELNYAISISTQVTHFFVSSLASLVRLSVASPWSYASILDQQRHILIIYCLMNMLSMETHMTPFKLVYNQLSCI